MLVSKVIAECLVPYSKDEIVGIRCEKEIRKKVIVRKRSGSSDQTAHCCGGAWSKSSGTPNCFQTRPLGQLRRSVNGDALNRDIRSQTPHRRAMQLIHEETRSVISTYATPETL